MSHSSNIITTAYFQQLPQELKVAVHTDIGNDPDDALALFLMLQAMQQGEMPKGSLQQIVTTLYRPAQKAAIAAKICSFMENNAISIFPGSGCDAEKPSDFMQAYPFWPAIWGIPGSTNAVSLGQGRGYEALPLTNSQITTEGPASFAASRKDTVMLGLAPFTDLAKMVDRGERMNRLVIMGGYFGKENNGNIEVARAGYNTAIDPDASEKVLTQTKYPVLIFNSQHVTDWQFSWKQEEILAILFSEEKNELGEALAKDLTFYWSEKKPKPFGSLVMADVLTVYAGVLHPELIKATMPVEFTFHAKHCHNAATGVNEPIDMMHAQAKTLFSVNKKDASNIHIVTELTVEPEILRNQIIEKIATSLFFKNKKTFWKAVELQRQNPLTAEQIKLLLAE